jgi:hypothetical protein
LAFSSLLAALTQSSAAPAGRIDTQLGYKLNARGSRHAACERLSEGFMAIDTRYWKAASFLVSTFSSFLSGSIPERMEEMSK